MESRDALRRRPVLPERRAAIGAAMLRIGDLVDRGVDATDEIAALNEATGHRFSRDDFHCHCGAADRAELVEWACAPPPARLPDVTRDELVEIVRRILADPADDWYIAAFDLNTVMPAATDLIFHPPPELNGATAEAIVDAALAYRPIVL